MTALKNIRRRKMLAQEGRCYYCGLPMWDAALDHPLPATGNAGRRPSIIGVDLAKNVFQLHGAAADGTVLFRKKLTRPQFQRFIAEQPQCPSS